MGYATSLRMLDQRTGTLMHFEDATAMAPFEATAALRTTSDAELFVVPSELDASNTCSKTVEDGTQEIADLYGFRWNSELDIRSIKDALNLGHLRCKSPTMIRREFWTTLLAYNLIRTTAAGAALLHGKLPRQISFTGACQYVLANWMLFSSGLVDSALAPDLIRLLLKQIAQLEVANRPGRLEPRVVKQRPKRGF